MLRFGTRGFSTVACALANFLKRHESVGQNEAKPRMMRLKRLQKQFSGMQRSGMRGFSTVGYALASQNTAKRRMIRPKRFKNNFPNARQVRRTVTAQCVDESAFCLDGLSHARAICPRSGSTRLFETSGWNSCLEGLSILRAGSVGFVFLRALNFKVLANSYGL